MAAAEGEAKRRRTSNSSSLDQGVSVVDVLDSDEDKDDDEAKKEEQAEGHAEVARGLTEMNVPGCILHDSGKAQTHVAQVIVEGDAWHRGVSSIRASVPRALESSTVAFRRHFAVAIFDLDRTLWLGDCGALVPPLRHAGPREIMDARGTTLQLARDALAVLLSLRVAGCRLGIASLAPEVAARRTMALWDLVPPLIDPDLVHVGRPKADSLRSIKASSGASNHSMAFFDDLLANVHIGERLGVIAVRVGSDGLEHRHVLEAAERAEVMGRSRSMLKTWLGKGKCQVVNCD